MKNILKSIGKAACYVLLFVLSQFAVSIVVSISAVLSNADSMLADPNGFAEEVYNSVMGNATVIALAANVLTLVVLIVFFAVRKKDMLTEISAKPLPAMAYMPLSICGMCLAVIVTIVLSLLPIPESVWQEYAESSSLLEATGALAILSTVVIAPIVEETVFRGLVYTRLKRAMPKWIAMVLQAAVFGLLHGQKLWAAYAFVIGMLLCIVFESTGSIFANMVMHISFNLMGGYILGMLKDEAAMYVFVAAILLLIPCWRYSLRIIKGDKAK
ncbi:MAG TPA: CPBP family intramembrane glutamic endopeptidase [Clostridia bacterium]|jgi:membrane protease YdiL (CAAX protease family)|nr:CPBP family intramembrane glutamic endopeptidase [Clostridia bacterium]